MRARALTISAAFAAGLAAMPLSSASAQYYSYPYPPCSPFPLAWPFCVAGAVVGLAATIVTAPFRAFAGPPLYGGYYGPPPFAYNFPYPPPGYPASPGYPPPGSAPR